MEEQAQGYEAKVAELERDNREKAERYEAKIAELERDNREKAEWAIRNQQTAVERTNWALNLDRQVRQLDEGRLNLLRASRWVKLGDTLGMGPREEWHASDRQSVTGSREMRLRAATAYLQRLSEGEGSGTLLIMRRQSLQH